MSLKKYIIEEILDSYQESFTPFDLGLRFFAEGLHCLDQVKMLAEISPKDTLEYLNKANKFFTDAKEILIRNRSESIVPTIEKYLEICNKLNLAAKN